LNSDKNQSTIRTIINDELAYKLVREFICEGDLISLEKLTKLIESFEETRGYFSNDKDQGKKLLLQ
jgi:hypothetical protein